MPPPSAGNPVNVGPFQRIVGVNWPTTPGPTTEILYGTAVAFEGGDTIYDFSPEFQIIRVWFRTIGGVDWTYSGPFGFGSVVGSPSPGSITLTQGATTFTEGGDPSGLVLDYFGNEFPNIIRLIIAS